jgi:hypothetical protein
MYLSSNSIAIGANAGPVNALAASNQTFIGANASGVGLTGTPGALSNVIILGDTNTDVYTGRDAIIARNAFAVGYRIMSDYRIKQNVTNLGHSYTLDNLRPVSYYNSKSHANDIGFIAHEVQKEYPMLVSGEKDGEQLQSINYTGLIPVLVKELNEQKQQNKENKEIIDKLVKFNEFLIKKLNIEY